ncbi:PIF / Ping-Pong family of plant transposase [Salvia divinorum]|uniref:PIF / Ping-Pong family of plant transposase n=1 Tax=Salvia divinorum TaxID=28513 RepID=A0ABD1GM00_SALDI
MGPVRGNKKKRKTEKKAEENSFISGSSEEGCTEWWDVLSKTIAGSPSSSQILLNNFRSTFKVSRKTFDYICSLVKEHMMAKTHFAFTNGKPMTLNDQVALALVRLGSGNSLVSIGESFGAHHSTVSQVTWRFVEAIEEKGLCHLQWPSTESEMTQIKQKFEKIRGLPNCCGAIDTTHITMLLTSSDQEADTWLDHKQNHSMILQAIVDPDLRFRNIVTGWPGKMTNSFVLQSSSFFKLCQKGEKLNEKTTHLSEETELTEYIIGGFGFPLLPWLVTPYLGKDVSNQGKELSKVEADFNTRLLATQAVAEKALERLKEVWKMIHGEMWRPDRHKLPRFILVCCVLHNIIIDMKEDVSDDLPSSLAHDGGYRQEICESVDKAGSILRDRLSMYFSDR